MNSSRKVIFAEVEGFLRNDDLVSGTGPGKKDKLGRAVEEPLVMRALGCLLLE